MKLKFEKLKRLVNLELLIFFFEQLHIEMILKMDF